MVRDRLDWDAEQGGPRSLAAVRRSDPVARHVVEWVRKAQRVPLVLVCCAPTSRLTMGRMTGRTVARAEIHYKHEMDRLVEDGCRNRYDMHPVREVALPAVQYRCHDNLDVEANPGIDLGGFSEEIDEEAVILCGTVGRGQVGCRTGCAKRSRASEGQIQPDWLGRDGWEVMIFVRLQLTLDQTPVGRGIFAASYHPCTRFCALLVEVACDFEVGTHRAHRLEVENIFFAPGIGVDHISRDPAK